MRNGGLHQEAAKSASSGAGASVNGAARPSREQAEEAVRTLIAWAGDDPSREGLLKTPGRVVDAWSEYFSGYHKDPADVLGKTFSQAGGYKDIVLLRAIPVNSHCEHHIAPFIGTADIAYLPDGRYAGLSKLARIVEVYARRLQTQETLTAQIGSALEKYLKPKGVAVSLTATHQCMTIRGIAKPGVATTTLFLSGKFRDDESFERRFLRLTSRGDEGRHG